MTAVANLDEELHAEAITARLGAVSTWPALDYDEVPGTDGYVLEESADATPPARYFLLSVERRFVDPVRSTGTTGRSGWRVTIRAVAETVTECRRGVRRIAEALDGQRVQVGGAWSTRAKFESPQAPEFDDGAYTALSIYTYSM